MLLTQIIDFRQCLANSIDFEAMAINSFNDLVFSKISFNLPPKNQIKSVSPWIGQDTVAVLRVADYAVLECYTTADTTPDTTASNTTLSCVQIFKMLVDMADIKT